MLLTMSFYHNLFATTKEFFFIDNIMDMEESAAGQPMFQQDTARNTANPYSNPIAIQV